MFEFDPYLDLKNQERVPNLQITVQHDSKNEESSLVKVSLERAKF